MKGRQPRVVGTARGEVSITWQSCEPLQDSGRTVRFIPNERGVAQESRAEEGCNLTQVLKGPGWWLGPGGDKETKERDCSTDPRGQPGRQLGRQVLVLRR